LLHGFARKVSGERSSDLGLLEELGSAQLL
jgi:hypothetical protein